MLEVSRATLYRYIKEYEIQPLFLIDFNKNTKKSIFSLLFFSAFLLFFLY
ncbi:MAG TPA: hypothetical protein VIK86_00790 [Candidatus Paceibacterota bacterium]